MQTFPTVRRLDVATSAFGGNLTANRVGGACSEVPAASTTPPLSIEVDFPQNFPGNCSPTALLTAIQPGDGKVNWWSLFFHSGALVALLLQLVLAHWFLSWFAVLRPLTMHRGRVMIP